ncbi:MAG: thiol peroxidase [Gammaproteobacteria bacterium]|nr:thiol peroxidase [Gammaproteobacteria bacterium]
MAALLMQGQEIHTNGELPTVGGAAPLFVLTDEDLRDAALADYRGATLIINVVPSLDTPTCLVSTRRLSAQIEDMPNTRLLVISADLPFAQGRVLLEAEITNVEPLSMMRDREFAIDYGLLIVDGPLRGIAARALLVIDPNGIVVHAQLVADIADEPDYAAAIAAANAAG